MKRKTSNRHLRRALSSAWSLVGQITTDADYAFVGACSYATTRQLLLRLGAYPSAGIKARQFTKGWRTDLEY